MKSNLELKKNKMPRFHTVEINKTEWIVPERYQMLTPVGSGAYGQVWYVFILNHNLATVITIMFFSDLLVLFQDSRN